MPHIAPKGQRSHHGLETAANKTGSKEEWLSRCDVQSKAKGKGNRSSCFVLRVRS